MTGYHVLILIIAAVVLVGWALWERAHEAGYEGSEDAVDDSTSPVDVEAPR